MHRMLGRPVLLGGRYGREPHGDVRGLECLGGHSDQVVPEGVQVDGLP